MTKNIFCLFGLHELKTIKHHIDTMNFLTRSEFKSSACIYRVHTIVQKCQDCGKEIVTSYKVKLRD